MGGSGRAVPAGSANMTAGVSRMSEFQPSGACAGCGRYPVSGIVPHVKGCVAGQESMPRQRADGWYDMWVILQEIGGTLACEKDSEQ